MNRDKNGKFISEKRTRKEFATFLGICRSFEKIGLRTSMDTIQRCLNHVG